MFLSRLWLPLRVHLRESRCPRLSVRALRFSSRSVLGKQGGVMELPPDAVALSSSTEKEALKKKRMMMQLQTGWRSHPGPSNKMRAEAAISLHHSPIPRADVPGHT